MISDTRIDETTADLRKAFRQRADAIKESLVAEACTDAAGDLMDQRDSVVTIASDKMKAEIWALPVAECRQEAAKLERTISMLRDVMEAAKPESEPALTTRLPWNAMVLALNGFGFLAIGSAIHAAFGFAPGSIVGLIGLAGLTYLGIAGATTIRNAVNRFNRSDIRQGAIREIPAAEEKLSTLNARIKVMEGLQKDAMELVESLAAIYDREFTLSRHALSIAKQFN